MAPSVDVVRAALQFRAGLPETCATDSYLMLRAATFLATVEPKAGTEMAGDDLIAEMLAGLEGVQGGPYKLDKRASYIWAPSAKGGDFPVGDYIGRDDDGIPVMRLRGWGYYTGKGHGALGLAEDEAEAIQRRTGEHLARCSPENIRALLARLPPASITDAVATAWRFRLRGNLLWHYVDGSEFEAANPEAYEAEPLYAHPLPQGEADTFDARENLHRVLNECTIPTEPELSMAREAIARIGETGDTDEMPAKAPMNIADDIVLAERDAAIANCKAFNEAGLDIAEQRDAALRDATFWEKFQAQLQDDCDKFKARAVAAESSLAAEKQRVVELGRQLGLDPQKSISVDREWLKGKLERLDEITLRLVELEGAKDGAYEERNKIVAALARLYPSGLKSTNIEGWSPDWHGCVYIDLPTGQVSWHFHDSQAALFDGIPAYKGEWDGHDTDEKYRRLAALAPVTTPPEQEGKL